MSTEKLIADLREALYADTSTWERFATMAQLLRKYDAEELA